MASLKGENLVLFYNISASEICSDKKGGLRWEGSYKRGANIPSNIHV